MNAIVYFFGMAGVSLVGLSYFRGAGITPYDLFFVAAFLMWIFFLVHELKSASIFNGYMLGFSLIVFGCVLALIETSDVFESLLALSKFVFAFIFFVVCVPQLIKLKWQFDLFLMVFAFSGALNAIGALLQLKMGTSFPGPESVWGRMTGWAEHPNELGLHCALASYIGLILFFCMKKKLLKILAVLFAVISGLGLILSSSMTALASLVASVFVVGFLEYRNGNRYVARFSLISILIVGISIIGMQGLTDDNSLLDRITAANDSYVEDTTVGIRLNTIYEALDRIYENPLIGVGNYEGDTVSVVGDYVHNQFLRAFREGGLFSFVGIILIYLSVIRNVLIVGRYDFNFSFNSNHMLGLIVLIFINAMFAPFLFQRVAWVPFGILVSYVFINKNKLVMI